MNLDEKTKKIIIESLGIESLQEDDQTALLEQAGILIYQSVVTRAMEEMSDETVDEFEKLVEGKPSAEVMLAFFYEKIPNFASMVEDETKKYVEFTRKNTT